MQMRQLIDFGDAPVFDATAYPSIIVMQKGSDKEASESNTFQALNWTAGDSVSAFVDIFKNRAFLMKQSYLTLDGWQLDKPEIFELMQKLRNAGKPLGEYVDGKLYYGIKTGFNEAFVIDRETRDRLISEDPNCEEIIKPFLRGRDVKRWNIDFADKYLIKIESSENKTHPWSGASMKDAEQIFGKTYPSVQKRMLSCRDKLMKRCDQGHYYWELRSCVYYDIFAGSKLIYPDIAVQAEFAISYDEIYADCTLFATSVHGNYLPGVVNSTAVRFFLSNVCPRVRGDFMRFKTIYVSQIPIPQATSEQQSEIENLVERILKQKKANPDADVSELEEEINQIVYRLYGLTDEEIAIVEGV
jgi:adenine-specific DNA-methyltransferase